MALRLFHIGSSSNLLLYSSAGTSHQKCFVHHHMERDDIERYLGVRRSNAGRSNRNTNANERAFQKLRGSKSYLIDLPDDGIVQKEREEWPPSEMRRLLLKRGINPYKDINPRNIAAEQIEVGSLPEILAFYVHPPSFARPSWNLLDKKNLKNKFEEKKDYFSSKYMQFRMGIRRLKKIDGFQNFTEKTFVEEADRIYETAHLALIAREKEKLMSLITDRCFGKMWPEVVKNTVVWKLQSFTAPTKVENCVVFEYPPESNSGNQIAQINVRIQSQQSLAIYDRFGHHILGDPDTFREVVEYVVFENHVSSVDGVWRMHGKVYPDWLTHVEKQTPIHVEKLVSRFQDLVPPQRLRFHPSKYEEDELKKMMVKYETGSMNSEEQKVFEQSSAMKYLKKKKKKGIDLVADNEEIEKQDMIRLDVFANEVKEIPKELENANKNGEKSSNKKLK